MIDLIKNAIGKGAVLYSNVSGGKDGQAMTKCLMNNKLPIKGLVHADLGEVEWKESIAMCKSLSRWHNIPLFVVRRSDNLGLLEVWEKRLQTLKGTGKPFWSSAKNRYCTSDLKRLPINNFYTSTKENFIISCEGIRAEESTARAKKIPLTVRSTSSTYYKECVGVTAKGTKKWKAKSVEWCVENYRPDKRLVLTWFPIFNWSLEEVWQSYGNSSSDLFTVRAIYRMSGTVSEDWKFHPAYAYGNDRVSCTLCILGSPNDLAIGAKHNPEVLQKMIGMEERGKATFRDNWSLKSLIKK